MDWHTFTTVDFAWMLAIPALPLAAFVIQIFFGRWLPRKGDWVPTTAMGFALVLAVGFFLKAMGIFDPTLYIQSSNPPPGETGLSLAWLFGNAPSGAPNIVFSVLFDNLTAVMLVVVTGVSFLVHVYSIGYMEGDKRYGRFFAYLALFSFSMLGLVLSGNLLFLMVFWELVGLTSYLLIGFWFEKPSAAHAGFKAFITTRIGDVGMLLGFLIIFKHFQTLDIVTIFQKLGETTGDFQHWPGWVTAAGLLVFCGAVGKSAQFPLHIWLPDAMEGPTPVSALIHAATMVAAGVYLVGRFYLFFSPSALLVIAMVGSFTALFAAVIGVCQWDIKRVLAYSTVSQLGYMIAALGCGAYSAGLMHLMTHAWFKAGLFLQSGSVIIGMHHEQDMRHMGGLRKKMPITFWTMLICTLALCGIPLFAGFYSKDAIIAGAMHAAAHGGPALWLWYFPAIALVVAAGLTSFYMFRLIFLTFYGEPRSEHAEHAHETPWTMTVPLMVLAALALFSASPWIFNGDVLGHHLWFPHVVAHPEKVEAGRLVVEKAAEEHGVLPLVMSILVALGGIFLAWAFYYKKWLSAEEWARKMGWFYKAVYNKFYVDEFVMKFIVRPVVFHWNVACAAFDKYVIDGIVNAVGRGGVEASEGSGWFDKYVIDGIVNAVGFTVQVFGGIARLFQTGFLDQYLAFTAAAIALGAVLFFFFL